MTIARDELVTIDGITIARFRAVDDRSSVFHLAAARHGLTQNAEGWYVCADNVALAVTSGPHRTLRAACEAAGIQYPGEVDLRSVGHVTSGEIEKVLDFDAGL